MASAVPWQLMTRRDADVALIGYTHPAAASSSFT